MPAKLRVVKGRHPEFSTETLELFMRLDKTPPRERDSREFKDAVRTLMYRLNLTDEFWTMNSVVDRFGLRHPEGSVANEHWYRCRRVRAALLEAVGAKDLDTIHTPGDSASVLCG